jgi:hypothetical protein
MSAESKVEGGVAANDLRSLQNLDDRPRTFPRHAANVAFILIAIVGLFWRVFFLGETLIDVNTLNNQLPWGYNAPASDYPYNRRDLTDTYVTRDYFVVSAYRDGEFPLWNPYTMAGQPIYADGVTRTLSPFLVFYRFLDVPLGYSVARIAELMLAAVFMYMFLVAIGASANGALLGSIVFAFSAHSMLHLTGLGWWGGLMWLPLILLFVDRAIRRRSFTQSMLAGLCLAAQLFCGYLPNEIYYVGAIVLYYLFFEFVARRRGEGNRAMVRSVAMTTVTLVVGLAISATQWAPALELLSYSNRKIIGAELGYVYLPPWYLATLVFPNLFGGAYDAKALTLFSALGVSHDHILYLGIAALVPVGFCAYWVKLTSKKRRDRAIAVTTEDLALRDYCVFFALLAGLSLFIMMAAPLYVPLTRHVPILQVIRVAVRGGVLFLMAASALAALGTNLLLVSSKDLVKRFAAIVRRVIISILGFAITAVIVSYALKITGFAVETTERGRIAFIRKAAATLIPQFMPPALNIAVPLVLLLAAMFLLWALGERRFAGRGFIAAAVALLLIDLFWNSNQFDHTFKRSLVFPSTEITARLRALPPGRVLVTPSDLETNRRAGTEKIIAPPNTLLPYQIATVTGKNQQFPKWYREFASLIEPQQNLSHVVFDQYRSRYFDLLDVRYVMTHESAAPLSGYDLLGTAEGVALYENKAAMPRAFFVRDIVEVASAAESLEALRDVNFDPHITAVIETGDRIASPNAVSNLQPPVVSTSSAEPTRNQKPETRNQKATIVEDKRNRVEIETDNDREGLLVLSDNYYPGWQAGVDGAPVDLLRANHTMRAINVPAGKHVVSFAFMPAAFLASVYVSLAAAVLTLTVLILSTIKRRRG